MRAIIARYQWQIAIELPRHKSADLGLRAAGIEEDLGS